MNLFTNICLIYLFLVFLFSFKIIDLHNNQFVLHKLLLFLSVFFFQFFLKFFIKIINNCPINLSSLINLSSQFALFSIIGYSIYLDTKFMTYANVISDIINKKYTSTIYIAFVIVFVISFIKSIQMMFGFKCDDC
jgi:hypothetical protein